MLSQFAEYKCGIESCYLADLGLKSISYKIARPRLPFFEFETLTRVQHLHTCEVHIDRNCYLESERIHNSIKLYDNRGL